MASSRKFFSARPVVGLGVLIAIGIVVAWSYFFYLGNKVLSFGVGIPVISIPIVWSLYEILRLKRNKFKRTFGLLIVLFYVMTLLPTFFVIERVGGKQCDLLKGFGRGVLILGAELLVVSLLCRVVGRGRRWYEEMGELLKDKSFASLLMGCLVFWTAVLSMVAASKWYWIIFAFTVIMLNDTLAYVIGKLFGRRALSQWSPNKTKEGMFGSVTVVTLAVTLFFFFIDEQIRIMFLGNRTYWWVAIFPLAIGLFMGHVGDIYYSMHKRIFGIKDYSSVLGNHGGFWDRFDSSCFSLGFWGVSVLLWSLVR